MELKKDKNPGNFQDIHIEDYKDEYDQKLITADSFIFDFSRKKESLNGKWNYAVDQYDTCIRQKWFQENYKNDVGYELPVDFSFDEWPQMDIPSCWNTFQSEYLLYEGPMVFTRMFDFKKDAHKGEKVFFKIGAVNYTARIFLNKKFLGTHKGGSTPFFIDITSCLEKNNRIIIVADNTRSPVQVPTENTDWFNYGGIYRDVELIYVPEIYIKDFQCYLVPDNCFDKIHLNIKISESIDTHAFISIPQLEFEKEICVYDGIVDIDINLDLADKSKLQLWSPENPYLYQLELYCGEDKIIDKIGLRQISVVNRKIYLNGNEIFLKGISCHEDSVKNGKALTDAERRENFTLAKEMGCNFMRLAHYPHSENASRIADEVGLLLWEEIPVYWAIKFTREKTYLDAENQLAELILRDFNRASVLIWSVGNENLDSDERLLFMSRLAKKAHCMDKSRLVSAACLVDNVNNRISDRLAEYLDVIGINEYYGWYDPDFERLPQMLNNSSPDKPVIITEFGADAMPDLHGDSKKKGNEEYQEWVYIKQTETLKKIDYVRGMTPWILHDFRCPRRTSSIQKYYNRKGLLSPDKTHKKKAFYVMKKFYNSI